MALMETVTASICNVGHSQSWSRNWRSASAMITMDRGSSLMKAAGRDQRTLKSSPAQMASSIAPCQGPALQASISARRRKCWELKISDADALPGGSTRLDAAKNSRRLSNAYLAEDESSGARMERSRLRAPRRPIRLSSRRDANASM